MAPKGKVLIIDDVHPYLLEQLPLLSYQADYRPHIEREELLAIIGHYSGLVVRSKTNIDKEILSEANHLKFIGRAGSGLEIIDLEYAKNRGIVCFNTPEANSDAVGEQAVGMLLSLLANIHKSYLEVRNFEWNRESNRGIELSSLTVGIVGYGHTGSAFAKKLRGFGCKIIAYDTEKKGFGNAWVQECPQETIFEQADVVSFHIPLNSKNKYLINSDYLGHFKKNIFLLNLSRGKIMNTNAIINALKDGKIRGCALDVLENENISEYSFDERQQLSNLLSFPSVIITSHIGGWTHESYYKISFQLAEKIKQL